MLVRERFHHPRDFACLSLKVVTLETGPLVSLASMGVGALLLILVVPEWRSLATVIGLPAQCASWFLALPSRPLVSARALELLLSVLGNRIELRARGHFAGFVAPPKGRIILLTTNIQENWYEPNHQGSHEITAIIGNLHYVDCH